MKSKASLNELMGGSGSEMRDRKLGLSDLPELLGDALPVIDKTPVGRLRLISALRNRFGDQYRNIPGVEDIMKEFDEDARFRVKLEEMKMIKVKSKR
jgi:hypothetical protein